jgi:RNA polymerase sigma-70 factor (ECF subfamily)
MPLTRQDTALWRRDLIQEGEALLWQAARLRAPGPMQWEAAIHSAHAQRAFTGQTPWPQIAGLYALRVAQQGSVGAHIGHAVALAESGSVQAGLDALAALASEDDAALRNHQPYWVALAHLQRLAGNTEAAQVARRRALGLTADERVRRFLSADLNRGPFSA